MSIFNFKKQEQEKPLDVKSWINEHRSWKTLLKKHINTGDSGLTLISAMSETACPLGQWIQNEEEKHKNSPLFCSLKKQHAEFHKYAGAIFRLSEENKDDEAETILQNEFNQASAKLSNTLTQVQVHMSLKNN